MIIIICSYLYWEIIGTLQNNFYPHTSQYPTMLKFMNVQTGQLTYFIYDY